MLSYNNTLAEGVGFEPTESCPSHAFEACPFGRSGTLPGRKVNGYGGGRHQEFHAVEVTARHPLLAGDEILKLKKLSAEDLTVHADLFAHEGGFTRRPAWQVIDAARRQLLTGALSLATTPTTHVYLRDGHVYFAERSTDGGLGVRLLVEGVITRQQMGKGALLVSGVEHLGRMFQRDASIDRHSVELCVELMTDDVLTSVANDVIDHYMMTMYKRHANGIDRWLPTRIEVITHIVEGSYLAEPDNTITAGPGPRRRAAHVAEPVADESVIEPVIEPVVESAPLVEAPTFDEPTFHEPTLEDVIADAEIPDVDMAEPEPADHVAAALALAATFSEPAEPTPACAAPGFSLSSSIGNSLAAAVAGLLDPSAPLTPETLFAEGASAGASDNGSGISLAQSAVDAIMSSAIADEVAEAVRRALAAIDAAAQPVTNISPADFAASFPTLEQPATTSAA